MASMVPRVTRGAPTYGLVPARAPGARAVGGVRARRAPPACRAEGGAGVLDRPDLDQKGNSGAPSTEAGSGAGARDKSKLGWGGNFRIMLLDHEKHTEQLCVRAIPSVVPGVDADHARNCFATSRQLGIAMIASFSKEHSEHYAQRLWMVGCRCTIEPDTTTQ